MTQIYDIIIIIFVLFNFSFKWLDNKWINLQRLKRLKWYNLFKI